MPPYFIRNFDSKTLQPGPSVSLECVATGRPTPLISWLLNGRKIDTSNKFEIKEDSFDNSTVRSILTITNMVSLDGGDYTCLAKNKIDTIKHSNRVNVYGLPIVHQMDNFTVAAGEDVTFKCYVSGYPIKSITWTRGTFS